MQPQTITTDTLDTIIADITAARAVSRCIWPKNIDLAVRTVAFVLASEDQAQTRRLICQQAKIGSSTLQLVLSGKNSNGAPWTALCDRLDAMGVKLSLPVPVLASVPTGRSQPDPHSAIARAETANEMREAAALLSPIKNMAIAVTQKGEVITTRPPTVAPPSPMVAAPGTYAVGPQVPTVTTKIDPLTKDILVVTTERITFGSPAWCERMAALHIKPKT
jgi:hypothetical protein